MTDKERGSALCNSLFFIIAITCAHYWATETIAGILIWIMVQLCGIKLRLGVVPHG